jgi:hypothetical protein
MDPNEDSPCVAESSPISQDDIQFVLAHLPNRAPSNPAQVWVDHEKDPVSTTILKAGGFAAWFVYINGKLQARKAGTFAGKKRLNSIINKVERLSPEAQKQLGQQLAATIPGDRLSDIEKKEQAFQIKRPHKRPRKSSALPNSLYLIQIRPGEPG